MLKNWIADNEKSLSQRDRATAAYRSILDKCNWETILYGHYKTIFNHCDIIGLQSYRIR